MKLRYFFLSVMPLLVLTSCSILENPLTVDMKPKHEPMYNFTQSSALLGCVGKRIDDAPFGSIDVYISTIPDHTTPPIVSGFLTKDAVMMVTTALGRLNTNKVAIVGKNGGVKGRRQVQILGAFTELNRTVQSSAISSEAILPGGIEIGAGRDSNVNHIALDLAMSERNRIIPNSPTSVSVHILGSNGDVNITYDDGGDFAVVGAVGYSRQEGFHSASRLLIETSVAIMMANFYELDIKNCLQKNKRRDAAVQQTPYDKPVFRGRNGGVANANYGGASVKRKSHFVPRGNRNSRSLTKVQDATSEVSLPSKKSTNNFSFGNKNEVKNFLLGAGVPLNKPLIGRELSGGRAMYSWNVDGVAGQLYTVSKVDKSKFSFTVNKYLSDYIANCDDGGVTSSKNEVPFEQNRLVFYELGCTDSGGENVVDGVLFFENDGGLGVLSHRSVANKNAWRFNRDIIDVMQSSK